MSTHIPKVTNALFFILLLLSILGFVLIFFLEGSLERDVYIEEYKESGSRLEQEIF